MDINRKKVLATKSKLKDGSYNENHCVRYFGRTRKKLHGHTSVCPPLYLTYNMLHIEMLQYEK